MTAENYEPRRSAGRRAAPRRGARGTGTRRARPEAAARRGRSAPEPSTHLTAAGALLTILGCTLTGALLDGLFGEGFGLATWAGFIIGGVTASIKIRPADLLLLVISTPLVFLTSLIVAQIIRLWGSGGWLRTALIGLATALSEGAPWLFVGTGAVVAITWARGLPDNLRRLRAELRGETDEGPEPDDET
ncbi:MAG: hypothetical protein GEV03_12235 [Streptosporangiales bacterium]|nr:hypothetical protein [Streptosporangiales bacterium]